MVAQLQKIRKAQARGIRARTCLCGGKRGEFGIRRRQKDDIARRLAEVDRFRSVGNDSRRRREQMHF